MTTEVVTAVPAVQTMALGGRDFLVSELSRDSYATLQAWIGINRKHPFARLRAQKDEILKQLGPQEYRAMLSEAFAAAEDWPPSPMGLEGKKLLFQDDTGSAELFRVAVGQNGATVTTDEALEVLKSMDQDQTREFTATIFGLQPAKESEAEVAA